jgi:hypothetical protein
MGRHAGHGRHASLGALLRDARLCRQAAAKESADGSRLPNLDFLVHFQKRVQRDWVERI